MFVWVKVMAAGFCERCEEEVEASSVRRSGGLGETCEIRGKMEVGSSKDMVGI